MFESIITRIVQQMTIMELNELQAIVSKELLGKTCVLQLNEIEMWNCGSKIEAVKSFRQRTNCSLREALDFFRSRV